LENLKRLV